MGHILHSRIKTTRTLPLGEELMLALAVAAGDLGALIEAVLDRHGLTPRQYHTLRMLRGAGDAGLAHGDIGRRLLVRAPDVTRLMDQLVKHGWVRRVRSTDDARVALHQLTPAGAELLAAVSRPLQARHQQISKRLGARSARQLVALCERVIEVASTLTASPS